MAKIEKINVGGQAVMEGVMMRGPERVAVAVRKPDGTIVLQDRPFSSIIKKVKILGWPILRGAVVLIESLVLGMQALSFSGDVAVEEENGPQKKKSFGDQVWMVLAFVFAFALGLGLFFYLPLILTDWIGVKSGIGFNLVDGVIRIIFFLAYIFLISLWKDIRRVFEYHGAEHKSIFAFEEKKVLTVESAKPYTTLHPRCGTSFLFIVMITSIVIFSFLGRPDNVAERLIRLAFIPFIGGVSYELIKLSDRGSKNKIFKFFIYPGLWLQKITTNEPDEKQLEVAMVALKGALGQDPYVGPSKVEIVTK